MKTVKAMNYNAHKDYDVDIDADLLNIRMRIFGEDFPQTGIIFYEGSVGKFIKERIPSEFLVKLLTELRNKDKITYKLGNSENYIERIR